MAFDKEASRRLRRQIRDILNIDWDPIGGCPEDEYDGYVGKIAAMLGASAADEELGAYLRWAETVNMGLSQQPDRETRIVKVISRLRAVSATDAGTI